MKPGYAKILACIASVVQQLLQTPLVVLIDIYFEIMRTFVELVIMTILYTLYNVKCVKIKLPSDPFLIIDTLSKKIWLFWYPKNIPSRWYCPRKDILHAWFYGAIHVWQN